MRISCSRILFCICALSLPLFALPALARDRALIVGINEYINPKVSDLRSARGDAEKFLDFVLNDLKFDPADVVTLFDTQATGNAVRAAIVSHLIEGSSPGDRVLFYYSGHGTRTDDENGDEDDGLDEAIALSDAGVVRNGILIDDEFDVALSWLQDRRALFVFDSCHSGSVHRAVGDEEARPRYLELKDLLTETAESGAAQSRATFSLGEVDAGAGLETPEIATKPAEQAMDGTPAPGIVIWTAASAAQPSWETRNTGGIFTSHFLDALRNGKADANRNGLTTNSELLTYVRRQTESWCTKVKACDKGFTPTLTGPSVALKEEFLRPTPVSQTQNTTTQQTVSNGAQGTDPMADITDIFAVENQAGLRIWAGDGGLGDLRIGSSLDIRATAQRGGYLVLFDVDPLGNLYQLFPSPLSARGVNLVRPGETVVIPEAKSTNGLPLEIVVTEPAGQGKLLALLIEDDTASLSDFSILPPDLAPGPVPNAEDFLLDLAMSLQGTLATAAGDRSVNWSAAVLDYRISR